MGMTKDGNDTSSRCVGEQEGVEDQGVAKRWEPSRCVGEQEGVEDQGVAQFSIPNAARRNRDCSGGNVVSLSSRCSLSQGTHHSFTTTSEINYPVRHWYLASFKVTALGPLCHISPMACTGPSTDSTLDTLYR
jgi:hypothetical protein